MAKCLAGIELINLNQAAVELVKAADKQQAIEYFPRSFSPEALNPLIAAFADSLPPTRSVSAGEAACARAV